MPTSRFARRRAALVLSMALAACGDSSPEAAGGAPHPGDDPIDANREAPRGPLTLRLLTVDEGGAERETDTVVYGAQVFVRATGLLPGEELTIRAGAADLASVGGATTAHATFVADASGVVDTRAMAPKSGTYEGADADGLFWSMQTAPFPSWLDDEPFAATLALERRGAIEATRTLHRLAHADDVTCRKVTSDGLAGLYCAKAGEAPRVGALTFGGSEGGSFAANWGAMLYASWGIPTLGVAYFGEGSLPRGLEQIPLEYFEGAMKWLDGQPEVRPGKTIVAGGSRGGELSLLLGATYPRVSAVLADAPSGLTWGSVDGTAAAWTLGGVDVPRVPASPDAAPELIEGPEGARAYRTTPMFRADIAAAPPDALAAATIAVEKIAGPVLMLAGAADDLWPSCDFAKRAMDQLAASGHAKTYGDEARCFEDAGHAISFGGGPTTGSMWARIDGDTFSLGGTAKGNARAQREGDSMRRAFLTRQSR